MKQVYKVICYAGCILYIFMALLYPQKSYAEKTAYTIQTGSFLSEADARKQFDLVLNEMTETERDYLRIEKIGKYYSLRLGKFDGPASAESLFAKVKKRFSTAIVMNAYIKEERIIKRYDGSIHENIRKTEETSFSTPFPTGLIYTIQTGSFSSEKTANKQFDIIMKKLDSSIDFLRIEKIGRFYCLRAGNYVSRAAAGQVFKKITAIVPKAVIVDAYIRENRIVKVYRDTAFESKQTAKDNADQEQDTGAVKREVKNEVNAEKEALNAKVIEEKSLPSTKTISEKVPDIKTAESGKLNLASLKNDSVMVKNKADNEDPKDHEKNKVEASLQQEDNELPDLFFGDRKPSVSINDNKKIRPNNERKGDMYLNKKQYFRALEEYRQAPYKRPILRRKLAMLYYKMGFIEEAISEIEKVVESSPATSSDRMMLGTLYLAKGDDESAGRQFVSALEVNPGNTYAYCYMAELFLKEENYGMAWLSVKMAQHLGYEPEGLIRRLREVSTESAIDPMSAERKNLTLRLILVNTYSKAREILDRISGGELFEEIAGKESIGPGRNAGGYMGELNADDVGTEIAEAMNDHDAFAAPVIVTTGSGFHIVQRIVPFDINIWKKMVTDSGKKKLLTANGLK